MAGLEAWEGGMARTSNGKKRYSVGLEKNLKKNFQKMHPVFLPKKNRAAQGFLPVFSRIAFDYQDFSLPSPVAGVAKPGYLSLGT